MSHIQVIIDQLEKEAFEQWAIAERYGYRDDRGELMFHRNGGDGLFAAWQGRAKLVKQCRGIAHAGCEYLAVCGSVCDKCGRTV